MECPEFAHADAGSDERTDCQCGVGFTGPDGGPCVACVAGKYKDTNGSMPCSLCSAGKYSPKTGQTSGSMCYDCALGYVSSQGSPDSSMLSNLANFDSSVS